jgi:hypothetical protein
MICISLPQEVLYHMGKEYHERFLTYPIEHHQVSAYKCQIDIRIRVTVTKTFKI